MKSKLGRMISGVILAAVGSFVAFFLASFWFSEGHGASIARLARILPGMTSEYVITYLGRPSTINRHDDGSESWFYTRGTFCQVKIYLSPSGQVTETDHDH